MYGSIVITLFLTVVLVRGESTGRIKHVVTLMLENRAFDHMLGWLKSDDYDMDGLTGKEYNHLNPWDTNSPKFYVNKNAKDLLPDPHHDIPDSIQHVFGGPNNTHAYPPPMSGFVANAEIFMPGKGYQVMEAFRPEDVPIISTLAKEFVLFDHWHSSVPGPTEVNRMYLHSATSYGECVEPDFQSGLWGYPQKTIQQSLSENNYTWATYYPQTTTLLWFSNLRSEYYANSFRKWDQFKGIQTPACFKDAMNGNLPTYTYLEPRYYAVKGQYASDQHPIHPVSEGEKLIKEVYETLRNSPSWEDTALLITYDEHGGFYDHYPTPVTNVPNPDGHVCNKFDPPFEFQRLGIRVPTILVSPWVKKGAIEHFPPVNANGDHHGRHYDHSSLSGTLKEMFNLPHYLTARDEWAGTFEHLFEELDEPRTDCPKSLPDVRTEENWIGPSHKHPLTGLQTSIATIVAGANGYDFKKMKHRVNSQHMGAHYVSKMTERFVNKLAKKQKSKENQGKLHKFF